MKRRCGEILRPRFDKLQDQLHILTRHSTGHSDLQAAAAYIVEHALRFRAIFYREKAVAVACRDISMVSARRHIKEIRGFLKRQAHNPDYADLVIRQKQMVEHAELLLAQGRGIDSHNLCRWMFRKYRDRQRWLQLQQESRERAASQRALQLALLDKKKKFGLIKSLKRFQYVGKCMRRKAVTRRRF